MNSLKSIYWYTYYELKQKGKAHNARKQGTLLTTVAILLFIMAVFFLLIVFMPDFEKDVNRFLKPYFGRNAGKFLGQIGALILLLIIYPIVNLTIGSSKSYYKYITENSLTSQDEQKTLSKKGIKNFFIPLILFFIALISLFIKTFIS